jgi:hypothetical protein
MAAGSGHLPRHLGRRRLPGWDADARDKPDVAGSRYARKAVVEAGMELVLEHGRSAMAGIDACWPPATASGGRQAMAMVRQSRGSGYRPPQRAPRRGKVLFSMTLVMGKDGAAAELTALNQ